MNTAITSAQQEAEMERIVAGLPDIERVHLRAILYAIVRCYDTDNSDCAVLVLGSDESLDSVASLNCNSMVAASLLQGANDFLGFVNTKDAPPKEMFN
jgi:hypothetical protein